MRGPVKRIAQYGFILFMLTACSALSPTGSQTMSPRNQQICKAGIATTMQRDPAMLLVDRVENDIVFLVAVEGGVKSKWGYKCRLDGNRIIFGGENGRWMTDRKDAVLTFETDTDSVTVTETFPSQATRTASYTFARIGE